MELISECRVTLPVSYVVIACRHDEGWLFVKHRRRGGWEMPAGHPGEDEGSVEAAVRELTEETGALDFIMKPITYYSVDAGKGKQYGRLFYAEAGRLGSHSDTDEIEEVRVFRRLPRNLSLPEVMTFLYQTARRQYQ